VKSLNDKRYIAGTVIITNATASAAFASRESMEFSRDYNTKRLIGLHPPWLDSLPSMMHQKRVFAYESGNRSPWKRATSATTCCAPSVAADLTILATEVREQQRPPLPLVVHNQWLTLQFW
jgi:hypothetical protein